MIYGAKCPHCGEETEVEKPFGDSGGDDSVELQQDCTWCEKSFVAVFAVEYVLQGVHSA